MSEHPQVIANFDDQTRWLEERTLETLVPWLGQALKKRITTPLFFRTRDHTVAEVIVRHFRNSRDAAFEDRFCRAINTLLDRSHVFDSPEYFADLLYVTGATSCRSLQTTWRLLDLAESKVLHARVVGNQELHQFILSTLIGIACAEAAPRLESLLKRDIRTALYAPVCYAGLYRMSDQYAVKYMPLLARLASRYPHLVALPAVLRLMLDRVDPGLIWQALPSICAEVTRLYGEEVKQLLTSALLRAQPVYDYCTGDDYFIAPAKGEMEWTVFHNSGATAFEVFATIITHQLSDPQEIRDSLETLLNRLQVSAELQ